MKKEPYFLNIAPMMPGHEEELAADIAAMAEAGSITHNAFSCTIVPEGDPVIDKAALLGERFVKHRDALRKISKVPCGILIQATIGHGWTPNSPASGQKLILWNGFEPYIFCPLDPGFRTYIREQVGKLASLKPDFFMLDDDFRMLTGRGGCHCPLHLAGFNQLTGQDYTAESLRDAIRNDRKIAEAYDAWMQQTMTEVAQIIRDAIDSVIPGHPCAFCMCSEDIRHAPETGRILQGNAPLRIRIENGYYLQECVRTLPGQMLRSARQALYLPEGTEILDEPDTCPQNRYSTSASMLHNHLTRAMIAGYFGAKIWITRMSSFEPGSGKTYRNILKKYNGFYRALCDLQLKEDGILVPLPAEPPFNYPLEENRKYLTGNWFTLTSVLGFPFHLNKTTWRRSSAAALAGDDCDVLSDQEIKKLLELDLILDGSAALKLCRRGFGPELGIEAEEWGDLPAPTFEADEENTFQIPLAIRNEPVRLKISSGIRGEIQTWIHHKNAIVLPASEIIAPGSLRVTRPDGHALLVMAVSLARHGFASFAYLSETRKALFAEQFKEYMSVYCKGDAEVLVQSGRDAEDNRIAILHALSPDGLEQPCLVFREPVNGIEHLQPDGSWKEMHFEKDGDAIRLDLDVKMLYAEVLRIH